MKRIAVAALLAALLLAACSRGPAAVDEAVAGPLHEGSPVVPPPIPPETSPIPAERPPVDTPPPPIVGGPPDTPLENDPLATETVVSIVGGSSGEQSRVTRSARAQGVVAQNVSVTDSVREGGSFRIRVGFAGRYPTEGGCTLGVSDSNGDQDTVTSWANGDDTSAVVRVAHDNDADDGRTVTVSINSCDFPDLERAEVAVRIGERNSIAVAVTTAGPIKEDPNTYVVNFDRIDWVEGLQYVNGRERMLFRVFATIDPAPNWGGYIYLTWSDDHSGESRTAGIPFSAGETNPWNGYFVSLSPIGAVRTATATLTDVVLTQRSQGTDPDGFTIYYAPPSTYELGDTLSGSGTMTTWEYDRGPEPVYSSSVSPDPVTEGETVTLTVSVTAQRHGQQIRKTYDNWRVHIPWSQGLYWENPHYTYVTLSDYRGLSNTITKTVLVCCDGDGWLPEGERPSQRTYSVSLTAKDGTLRTIASANVRAAGE